MEYNQHLLKVSSLILLSADKRMLKKAVCSKPSDKTLIKTVITLKSIGGAPALQAELFHKDNKATHKNFPLSAISAEALAEFLADYMQINLICDGADCEYRLSSSGKSVVINDKKIERALAAATAASLDFEGNNRRKKYILDGSEPFLRRLGVADENGRVYDKKQAKFRQINRFLEIIRDAEDKLPSDSIRICDLCCGKSYLSFAVYHYFTHVLGRRVRMTGVDLKPDVIAYCNEVAGKLGFDGLEFLCGDVGRYDAGEHVHMVISLHACDTATDLVLERAMAWDADVILSTPCCHHELNHSLNCPSLAFIAEHSMLRQKLCDAATDALRLKLLASVGYAVCALELIDPEETPKNIMLRALKRPHFDPASPEAEALRAEYAAARAFLLGG